MAQEGISDGRTVVVFGRIVMPVPKGVEEGSADIKLHSGMGGVYPYSHPYGDYVGVGDALSFSQVENKATTEGSEFQVQLALSPAARQPDEATGSTDPKTEQLKSNVRGIIIKARNATFKDNPMVIYVAATLDDGSWPTQPYPLLFARVSHVVIEPKLITVSAYTSASVLDKVWYVPTLQEDWSQRAFRNEKDGVYRYNTRDLAESGVQF